MAAKGGLGVALPRVEDWLLSIWIAVVGPSLLQVQSSSIGLFDSGRPVDGVLDLIAVFGAVICLMCRDSKLGDTKSPTETALMGPFLGGLLLISISGVTALSLESWVDMIFIGILIISSILIRVILPPVSTVTRRALITPYTFVTGSLFWRILEEVTLGGQVGIQLRSLLFSDFQAVEFFVGFLLAFSAVFYTMLIFAPRRVVEPEGDVIAWIIRYILFAISIVLGIAWLSLI